MESQEKKNKISYSNLKLIGISLTILSLGLAIAYAGLIWYSKNKPASPPSKTPITTPSGKLK